MAKGKHSKKATEKKGNITPQPTIETDYLSQEFFDARMVELRSRVTPKRFAHCLGVSATAARMANLYSECEKTAALAGLLHDWDKGYNNEQAISRVRELGLDAQLATYINMPHLLHGPTAAVALGRRFSSLPKEILSAISLHTTGGTNMSNLDIIIYVADAIEPARHFDGVNEIRKQVGNAPLTRLFMLTFQHVLHSLVERGKPIHPNTVDVWNAYIKEGAL